MNIEMYENYSRPGPLWTTDCVPVSPSRDETAVQFEMLVIRIIYPKPLGHVFSRIYLYQLATKSKMKKPQESRNQPEGLVSYE